MIESIENALQIATLMVCAGIALIRAVKTQSRAWALLAFFYSSWGLGDVYWLVCLIFFDRTPQISVVSDLSWYASYIFLYMLLREAAPPDGAREKRFPPWLGPLFAGGMAVFFMRWGEIGSNLIYALLMSLLLFSVIRRFLDRDRYAAQQPLCVMILALCLLEYALWTSSCFFKGDGLKNPYYWFDFLLTVSVVFLLPAVRGGAEALAAREEARRKPNEQQGDANGSEAARQL